MPPRNLGNSAPSDTSSVNTATTDDLSQHHNNTTTTTPSLPVVSSIQLGRDATVLVRPAPGQPAFLQCESQQPHSTPPPAELVNQRDLNLHLGHSWCFNPDRHKLLLWIIQFLNRILISWWERHAMRGWNALPLSWRRALCLTLWKWYLPLHKVLLGRVPGIHRDASLEYHALTTIMYWGRYFPVTVERMRFSLGQLNIWCREQMSQTAYVETIRETEVGIDPLLIPTCQRDHCTVRGKFIHRNGRAGKPTEWTLMWIYGGAFLSGDVDGNLWKADEISRRTGMDVFLAEYRLVPEYDADDVYFDMALAYRWLHKRKRINPNKIILLGISSGAAVITRQLQYIAEKQRGETLVPSYMGPLIDANAMPAGAVLLGPFVDFTTPQGSLLHYPQHDLIVNQRVVETGLPYLDTHVPDRRAYSPVHRNFQGLPPLAVVVSEHEAVYDMSIALVNRAREAGVECTLACWKYMCHVFSFLDAFCPEGKQSLDFCVEWIRHQQRQPGQQKRQPIITSYN